MILTDRVKKLFSGVVVVIDDEVKLNAVERSVSQIDIITDELEKEGMPCLRYNEIPSSTNGFENVSFLIMDWNLKDKETGMRIPDLFEKQLNFLWEYRNKCFAPIFIFSDENPDDIKDTLQKNGKGLYNKRKLNLVWVEQKSFLTTADDLFTKMGCWLEQNIPMYLLKEWDMTYSSAKRNLFFNFYKKSTKWPLVIWKSYEDDGVSPKTEMKQFIERMISSNMGALEINDEVFLSKIEDIEPREINDVIEGQVFLEERYLSAEPETGDIFYIDGKYYLNIRPACDLVFSRTEGLGNNSTGNSLYLLEGKRSIKNLEIIFAHMNSFYNFSEKINEAKCFPIDGNHMVCFSFKNLIQKEWSDELKNARKGRLLAPYLIRVQMRYSAFLQRQGLPRYPKEMFKNIRKNIYSVQVPGEKFPLEYGETLS